MSKADDKLLAAALDVAAKSLRDVWEDGSINGQLALWRLSNTQLTWLAAQAIFAWQTERRKQAIEANMSSDEFVKTFVQPEKKHGPAEEAMASFLLPALRTWMTERDLHMKPLREWRRDDVTTMVILIGKAWEEAKRALEEVPEDEVDKLPMSAGNLLAAG